MDPVSLALIGGIAAGVTEGVASQVVVEAYQALKNAIQKKWGKESKINRALEDVEKEPELKPYQDLLVERLKQFDVKSEPHIIQLAESLLQAIGPGGLKQNNINAQGANIGIIGDHAKVEDMHFGKMGE